MTGDVVVRFRSDIPRDRRDQVITSLGCRIDSVDPVLGYALVRSQGRGDINRETGLQDVRDLLAVLARRGEVVYAEPSYLMHAYAGKSYYDPYEWNLFARGTPSGKAISDFGIQAEPAWAHTRGAGITVAVVDTGVAYEEYNGFYQAPGLASTHFTDGYDFINNTTHANDDAGHGTFVTGVLASNLIDGAGTSGVAPEVTVMPVKVLGQDGQGRDYDVARGVRWAADHGAGVINLSLGAQGSGQSLSDAIRYAASKDCVVVAAAGNENASQVSYPAAFTDCIAVGSSCFDGTRAPYSNRGRKLELMAPGGNLGQDLNHDGRADGIVAQTFDPQNGYDSFDYQFWEGTSFSSPQVAGVVALVRAANPNLAALDIRLLLQSTALDLGADGRDNYYGYGLVDALGAVEGALAAK
jgi:serine protease